MKTFIIALSILLSPIVKGQTKLIAHKSHSGSNSTFNENDYNDRFGLNENFFITKKVIYLKDDCIITKSKQMGLHELVIDTICGHFGLQENYTFEEFQKIYPEASYNNFSKCLKFKPSEKKSQINLILLSFTILLLFFGIYFKKSNTNEMD